MVHNLEAKDSDENVMLQVVLKYDIVPVAIDEQTVHEIQAENA